MQREIEKPEFSVEQESDGAKLIITRDISEFAHIIRYKSISRYEIFNDGYNIALIGYNNNGLFFCVIQMKGKYIITLYQIDELNKQPRAEDEISIKNYRHQKDKIYFIYLTAGNRHYIIDMKGELGYIEAIEDKFNLHVKNKGSYCYLSKTSLDEILLNLLR